MSFQGDIPSLSLADVIQNLANNQKSGVLTVRGARGKHCIVFEGGVVVSYVDETFPPIDWLIQKKHVPPDAKAELTRRYSKEGKTLGQLLEEMGLLDPQTYKNLLRRFVKERLYEVLSFRKGTFSFRSNSTQTVPDDRDVRSIGMSLSPTTLLMEAARRTDDWQKIREQIPSDDVVLVPAGDPAELQSVQDEVARGILPLLDGTRTVGMVMAEAPNFPFEVAETLARLVAEGKVRPAGSAPAGPKPEESPQELIPQLEARLREDPRNAELLAKLAELSEAAGDKRKAIEHLKSLAALHLEKPDFREARRSLEAALSLEPEDEETWNALLKVSRLSGDMTALLSVGEETAYRLRKLELFEVARARLEQLKKLFPQDVEVRLQLAETLAQLGQRESAAKDLEGFAKQLLRSGSTEEAERVLSKALEIEPNRQTANELLEKIRSGVAVPAGSPPSSIRTWILVALLFALCAQLCYELHVHGRFFQAAKSVFAEGLLEKGEYAQAIARIEAVRRRYFLSLTAIYKAPGLLEAIREGHEEAMRHLQERAAKADQRPSEKTPRK